MTRARRRARRSARRSSGLLLIPGVWDPFEDWLEPVVEPLVHPTTGQEWLTSAIAVTLGAPRLVPRLARVRGRSRARPGRRRPDDARAQALVRRAVRRGLRAPGAGDRRPAARPGRDARRPGRPRRGRGRDARRRRDRGTRPERAAAHLRPRDHGHRVDPGPRLPRGALSMLTTLLIVVPLAAALARLGAAALARVDRRARAHGRARRGRPLGRRGAELRLRERRAAVLDRARVVLRARHLLRGRALRLPVLARRADRRRRRRRGRLRALGGPRAAARLLRPDAVPHRLARRRLRGPGPHRLLRLLRGDADPDLRADRRLGRPGAGQGDGDVRPLHDGRLAADARVDHRVRDHAGHVPPLRDRDERRTTGCSSASSPPSR